MILRFCNTLSRFDESRHQHEMEQNEFASSLTTFVQEAEKRKERIEVRRKRSLKPKSHSALGNGDVSGNTYN